MSRCRRTIARLTVDVVRRGTGAAPGRICRLTPALGPSRRSWTRHTARNAEKVTGRAAIRLASMDTHPLWRPYDVPSEEEIAQARVRTHVPEQVEVVPPDPAWPATVRRGPPAGRAGAGGAACGRSCTSARPRCRGLHAKPVIDVSLTVADTEREEDYLPALEAAGLMLTVREPEHRCLRLADPRTNLHVWSPGAAEPQRHVAFRDWLDRPRRRPRGVLGPGSARSRARASRT